VDGLWATKGEGVGQLVLKISNLCDPGPPTSQTDKRTDRETDNVCNLKFSIPRYALVLWFDIIDHPPRGTPANIRIYFLFLETRIIALHFAADNMNLPSFKLCWWAP